MLPNAHGREPALNSYFATFIESLARTRRREAGAQHEISSFLHRFHFFILGLNYPSPFDTAYTVSTHIHVTDY